MQRTPRIYPLDARETLYALTDERGNTIGTGTREVCEFLLYIVTNTDVPKVQKPKFPVTQRTNIRSAIAI